MASTDRASCVGRWDCWVGEGLETTALKWYSTSQLEAGKATDLALGETTGG